MLATVLKRPGQQSTPRTRPHSTHRPWVPHPYQERGVDFLLDHGAGALFLDPGLGKTSIVLEAFRRLKEDGQASRMLVVAPLRVCQLVWRQEGQKWSQFRDLRFSLLHGRKKADALKEDADIHLINPEGIPWLAQQFFQRKLPWDTVVLDELTKFKNHTATRSKRLRKKLGNAKRRWGLTGSPSPNGYMDLFGQFLMLDDGAALGQYMTQFRDLYFMPDFNGYKWNLTPGSAERIEERIRPYVLRMSAEDYLELPQLQDHVIEIDLPKAAMEAYREMKKELLLALPEGVVTAANSGAVYSKLAQLANGAVYTSELDKTWAPVHSAKLDALEDLIEELAGQPLLLAYEFQHDLERIRERLGKDTPSFTGLSGHRAEELEAEWNRGNIPVLLVHPASAGHGLNLQQASADSDLAHVGWFSVPWDLELYEQLIRRVRRQGSRARHVINHLLIAKGTIDELKVSTIGEKDVTQQKLLMALNAEIMQGPPAPIVAGSAAHEEENTMGVTKLGFHKNASAGEAEQTDRPRPASWGKRAEMQVDENDLPPAGNEAAEKQTEQKTDRPRPAGWGKKSGDAPAEPDEQRETIRSKIAGPTDTEEDPGDDGELPAAQRALEHFGAGIVQRLEGPETGEDAPGGTDAPADDDQGSPGEDGAVAGQTEPTPAAQEEKKTRGRRKQLSPTAPTPEEKTEEARTYPTDNEIPRVQALDEELERQKNLAAALASHQCPSFTINVNVNIVLPPILQDLASQLVRAFLNEK